MKTRIISAVVLLPLLLAALLFAPEWVTAAIVAVSSAIAAYELLFNTGIVRHVRLIAYSMIMAALVPLWCYWGRSYAWGLIGLLVFCTVLFGEMMASHVKLRFEKVIACFVGGILIPFLFASTVRIHNMSEGRYYIILVLVLTFLPDSGAYFAGRFFGKHKLAPVISPKKTVEGAIGAVLVAMVGVVLYSLALSIFFDFKVNYAYAVIYGVLGSLADIFGDLCFSVIKRQTGIKDYGRLIPGHGGILDRFDSMILVGPLTEALLILIPLAVY